MDELSKEKSDIIDCLRETREELEYYNSLNQEQKRYYYYDFLNCMYYIKKLEDRLIEIYNELENK